MEHEELAHLLKENRVILQENTRLLEENNSLLRKMRRNAILSFWFKLVWIAVIIGGPVLLYWYVVQPMLDTLPFGDSRSGIGDTIQQYQDLFDAYKQ
jgi:hypothetical protein